MILRPPPLDANALAIVIDIGNTSTHLATWSGSHIQSPISVPTSDSRAFVEGLVAQIEARSKGPPPAIVVGSVVPEVLARVRAQVLAFLDHGVLVVGGEIPLPLQMRLPNPSAVGVDRACAAAAAYERCQTACTVVDFGTAVTVDLVDDDGVLLGGAILPGLALQFTALHEHTAQLPQVAAGTTELPYGRNTAEAMQIGVCRGLAGAVRNIVEGYATAMNRWPHVVATGGDAPFMGPLCDYLDSLVADLTLMGIGLAYNKYLGYEGG